MFQILHVIEYLGISIIGCLAFQLKGVQQHTSFPSSHYRRCNHVVSNQNRSPPVWPPQLPSTNLCQSCLGMGQGRARTTCESAGAL